MTFYYSSSQTEKHSVPDVEVFYMTQRDCWDASQYQEETEPDFEPGWYFWYCFSGCLPDSDRQGPFESEAKAIEFCRESHYV